MKSQDMLILIILILIFSYALAGLPLKIANIGYSNPTPTIVSQVQTSPTAIPTGYLTPTPGGTDITPTGMPPSPSPTPTIKPAKPTPTPTIKIGRVRPGNNWNEIYQIVSPKMCVPEALLYGIIQNEGARSGAENNWVFRNTYGWWGSEDDPRDNQGSTVISPDVVSQMMDDTWYRIKSSGIMEKKFNLTESSTMVTFDAIAAMGWHLWNTSLYRDSNCSDWPLKYIAKAACKYQGNCSNNYCENVCNRYNMYPGAQTKNCGQIGQVIDTNTCDFK